MLNTENIQSKIDSMIKEINSKNDESLIEDYNEVNILLYYNHCIDIFEFLKLYSKVQLNEILVNVAIIYDLLGKFQLSLEILDESLKIIPNIPSVILFKSGLFATMNKLDEAQKCLLKFKSLIGEDSYNTYIYSSIRIVYYYFLEYEENIILREISLIEKNFHEYYNNNVILHFLKSKILHKLSEKFKNIDKNRSYLYERDSIKNKEKAFNIRRLDAEYLNKKDINKEKCIKIISMVYPNFLNFKPKALVEYNSCFKSGFRLFFTLYEITKIIKLKILVNKLNKNNLSKKNLLNKKNDEENNINLNTCQKTSNNETLNISYNEVNKDQELILSLSKSVWLQRYTYEINTIYIIENKQIKEKKSMKNIDINNINYKLKTNYYIYEGYYSKMNLKDVIIKNININNKLKEMKNSFSNELQKDFEQSKKIYNSIKEENFIKKDQDIISRIQSYQNEHKENNIFLTTLIQSTNNKNKVNMDTKNDSKDKQLRISTETSSNKPVNLVKENNKKINNLEIITDNIQLDNNRKKNSIKKNLIYLGSNKNVIKIKSTPNSNTINGNEKKQAKKISIKSFNKNNNEKSNNNLFTNAILRTESLYTIRNSKKYYLYPNKNSNSKKAIIENKRNENDVASVKADDKNQKIYNRIRPKKGKNKNNSNKNNIYINNSQQNNTLKKLIKYFKKKDENSNNKNTKINKGKNGNKYLNTCGKELYNKILERKVKKKFKKKYLNVDKSPYNTINVKESSNNNQKNINKTSSQNINKLLINNYYCKIKTYAQLNKLKSNRENKKKREKKNNFFTIVLSSLPKTIINTPNYKKLSLSNSPWDDSKDKKKGSSNNNIHYKKLDI